MSYNNINKGDEMEDLKLIISEMQGICPSSIRLIHVQGEVTLIQYSEESRGYTAMDHDDDEYCFFHSDYGYREVYDIIKATDVNEALSKALKE